MEQYGAAVVECSWVRIKEVPWQKIGGKCERLREPLLLLLLLLLLEIYLPIPNIPLQYLISLQQTQSTMVDRGD